MATVFDFASFHNGVCVGTITLKLQKIQGQNLTGILITLRTDAFCYLEIFQINFILFRGNMFDFDSLHSCLCLDPISETVRN